MVRNILESGRGNGSGGRLACGVAVRGGGERGLGRSSGAGALTAFAESRFPEWETAKGGDKNGAACVGVWSSTAEADETEAASISAADCALTKREEEEPGRGSEKGSSARRAYGPGPGLGEGDGGAEGEGLATMSSSRTLSSDVWRARCFPPPSTEWCDERRDQNAFARRATSTTREEDVEEADSRADFRRCRSATSHSFKFSCTRRVSVASSVVGG